MDIIKVSAINSTNEFAWKIHRDNSPFDPVCVVANNQTKGRGQRGADWQSKAGENLTFSVLYPKLEMKISSQFVLSAAVSLAIVETLQYYNISRLKVKWPNDIMSANFKIGGILIENILKRDKISASVIGVGLNVNQLEFENLPQAASLKMLSGKSFDLEVVLHDLLKAMEKKMSTTSLSRENEILENYTNYMFSRDKVSTFQLPDNSYITGIIRGITTTGKLILETEDSIYKNFELKEIKLMY